jgi:hypothetical protein
MVEIALVAILRYRSPMLAIRPFEQSNDEAGRSHCFASNRL